MKNKTILILAVIVFIVFLLTFKSMKLKGMVSNFKIRNDGKIIGQGYFGAPRSGGTRKHSGIDIAIKENQPVYAPFDVKFKRIAYPYKDHILNGGVYVNNEGLEMKIFYFKPITTKQFFKKGETIGFGESVSKYYNEPKMTDHIHLELRDKNNKLLNPEKYI